ncbi:hypothetical protein OROGR_034156 [Orobanche gracilis]
MMMIREGEKRGMMMMIRGGKIREEKRGMMMMRGGMMMIMGGREGERREERRDDGDQGKREWHIWQDDQARDTNRRGNADIGGLDDDDPDPDDDDPDIPAYYEIPKNPKHIMDVKEKYISYPFILSLGAVIIILKHMPNSNNRMPFAWMNEHAWLFVAKMELEVTDDMKKHYDINRIFMRGILGLFPGSFRFVWEEKHVYLRSSNPLIQSNLEAAIDQGRTII